MSSSASYQYELERQRRREHALARIRATTQSFLERYHRVRDDLRRDGLDEFAPQEVAALDRDLAAMDSLLATDPEGARTVSQRIAADVYALPHIAREARRVAEAAAVDALRRRQEVEEQAREGLEASWRSLVGSWQDGLARQLAFHELSALRRRYMAADATESLQVGLAGEIAELRKRFEVRAQEVRADKVADARHEAQRETVKANLDIAAQSAHEAPEAATALREALSGVDALPAAEFAERIATATARLDAAVVDERCRREVVKGVVQSLRESGFVTDAPWRRVDGGRDEVVVKARRPAGSTAEFRVTLAGDLAYTFDNYEGAACKKDIGTVLPRLEEIYGVRLSNQRVVWENPDELDRTARTQPGGNEEGGHGR